MARSGISYFDVSRAAEAIRDNGIAPTVDRVRERLGTGSKSTLAPLLKRWREQQGEVGAVQGLPGDLVEAVRALQERAQTTADNQWKQAEAELQAVIDALNHRLVQAESSVAHHETTEQSLRDQLQSLTEDNRQLGRALEESQRSAITTEIQRDEAWSRIDDLTASLEAQKLEVRAAQERFEHYQEKTAEDRQHERDQFRQEAQQKQMQIHQFLDQASQAESRYSELRAENRAQRSELDRQGTELLAMQEHRATLVSETNALKQRLKEAIEENQSLHTTGERAREHITELTIEVATAHETAKHSQQLLDRERDAIKSATDRVDQLLDDNRIVAQEKAVLQGQLKQLQRNL